MKAVITSDGAVRLNVPKGTIIEFDERDVDQFGCVTKATWRDKILFNLSLSPFCDDPDVAAELIDD